MKYLFILFLASAFAACTNTDQTSSVDKAKAINDTSGYTTIEWLDSTNRDIGNIEQGQVLQIQWHLRNSGNKPLIIANVRPGCGCTGAKWTTEPIAPGKEGVVTAEFNSQNYPGTQHKSVFVKANNSNHNNGEEDILNFSVNVIPSK
jgi:hypothetical protein